ncbi:uncharacterized protein LOC133740200 isoform X2 [Rosa rugosa]|uniref:uncharacterized protein LOC133740200 isoform X2 n=1 Tax=Rosa rugosa TaxID=74645 RepID=UPI002B400B25|nr:uncharacterized protein LOC133740200 isoform X2 [Rosa rugosa]XP_062024108.1 uncharacterized protein LOC133740200 isoform X2 [Rosa rugosa]
MNAVEIMDESPAHLLGSANSKSDNGLKKPDCQGILDIMTSVWMKYILQRNLGPECYLERKLSSISMEPPISLKNLSACSSLASKRKHQQMGPETAAQSTEKGVAKAGQANENCSQSTFRSVTEISSVMIAMKGMGALESSIATGLPANSSERCADPSSTGFGNLCLPGGKVPLDFTLKMRLSGVMGVAYIQEVGKASLFFELG